MDPDGEVVGAAVKVPHGISEGVPVGAYSPIAAGNSEELPLNDDGSPDTLFRAVLEAGESVAFGFVVSWPGA